MSKIPKNDPINCWKSILNHKQTQHGHCHQINQGKKDYDMDGWKQKLQIYYDSYKEFKVGEQIVIEYIKLTAEKDRTLK